MNSRRNFLQLIPAVLGTKTLEKKDIIPVKDPLVNKITEQAKEIERLKAANDRLCTYFTFNPMFACSYSTFDSFSTHNQLPELMK